MPFRGTFTAARIHPFIEHYKGAGGQAADIRIEAQEIIKIRKRINEMIARETGQPVDKVTKDSERNFWMSAEQAVAYGLVDKIITKSSEVK